MVKPVPVVLDRWSLREEVLSGTCVRMLMSHLPRSRTEAVSHGWARQYIVFSFLDEQEKHVRKRECSLLRMKSVLMPSQLYQLILPGSRLRTSANSTLMARTAHTRERLRPFARGVVPVVREG